MFSYLCFLNRLFHFLWHMRGCISAAFDFQTSILGTAGIIMTHEIAPFDDHCATLKSISFQLLEYCNAI